MSRKAAVPTTARSAPARRASRTASTVRRPPPYWIGMPVSATIRRRCSSDFGRAGAGAVEVDDVQEARARGDPGLGGLQRVVVVVGRVLELALDQPDGLAVHDVDRRVEDHATAIRASVGEVAQHPQAVHRGLLGVELRGHHVAALHDATRSARRTRSSRRRRRRPTAGRRTSARGRRPRSRRARRSAPTRARRSRGSSRCAAAAGLQPRDASRAGCPRPRAPSCSVEDSNSSCIPRQIPSSGTPAAARSINCSPRPVRSRLRIASGNAPTPGRTIADASRTSSVTTDSAPTCASAFSTLRRLPIP